MPRRKTAVSPYGVILLMLFAVVIRGLMLLPSNEDVVLNKAVLQGIEHNSPQMTLEYGMGRLQTILFVHVGKTAGETIQWRMKISCKLRKSTLMKEECYEYFTGEESSLSKATIGHLHCDKLRPSGSLANSTAFLFSLRNPIDRITSWFQYMHPENCVPNRPSGACNLKKDNNPWGINFYQTCFPNVNDFVRSMVEPWIRNSINCSQFALETVQGKGPEGKHFISFHILSFSS